MKMKRLRAHNATDNTYLAVAVIGLALVFVGNRNKTITTL